MKKLLLSISTVILFCFLFCTFACATETAEEITQIETTEDPATVEENASQVIDYLIAVITNPSFWAATASIVTGAIPVIVIVVRNLNNVTKLINGKADAKTINNAIESGVTEIGNQFTVATATLNERVNKMEKALENENENLKQVIVMLSTFILHSKIGTSAKAEIMKMMQGYKEYTGTINEIIDQVQDAIALAEKEEEKVETPALDEVISLSIN